MLVPDRYDNQEDSQIIQQLKNKEIMSTPKLGQSYDRAFALDFSSKIEKDEILKAISMFVQGQGNQAGLEYLAEILTAIVRDASLGMVIQTKENTTINGFQVPKLTDDDINAIYNCFVSGKPVVVTDATGKMHFAPTQADSITNDICVQIVYFDEMFVTYEYNGVMSYKSI